MGVTRRLALLLVPALALVAAGRPARLAAGWPSTTTAARTSSIPDYQSGVMVDSDQVEIFLSTSSGFSRAPAHLGHGHSDATIADFDADGHPDLAIANAVDDTLTIFLGDGTGAFTATAASPLAVAARDMVTGDFDGDGKLDLATMLRTGQAGVKLLLGNGAGAFTDGGTTAIGTAYNALAATDFDSDGDLDLVTSGGGINGTVVTLRNDGTGALSVVNAMPRPTGPLSIAAADFDADGHPDIALAQTFGGGKIVVLHGDGTGTFGGNAAEWSVGASPFQVIATDVDGDQRPDLAVTSYGGDLVRVLRNDALPTAGLAPAGAQDLGSVTVGNSSARTFTVSSSGTAALHAGTVALTGAGFAKTADTCSGRIVANGSSCSVTVAFAPGAAGAAAGTLTIPTDDGPLVTALTATGVQTPEPPAPTPTPTPTPEPPAPPTADGGTPPSTPARRWCLFARFVGRLGRR